MLNHNVNLQTRETEKVENYRLTFFLTQFSPILENLLLRHMYLQVENSVCDQQHDFTKKRSPVTQLLSYLDDSYNQWNS